MTRPITLARVVVILSTLFGAISFWRPQAIAGGFDLELRSRVETGPETGRFHAVRRKETWDPKKTAVIVCDMWDLHHCLNATRRGAELAPRMNQLLTTARNKGALIIHAPSGCMKSYAGHPARTRAQKTPISKTLPTDITKWCYSIPTEEKGKYPIDQSDGGEDDDPQEHAAWAERLASMGRNPRSPWLHQADALHIDAQRDLISDKGDEIWSAMEQRGIDNVMLVGVHTNMCVLGRPFGLRQMSKNGKNVVLVRDMTDTMYNPKMEPYVSHFTGTDLIVEHIEKWVCPTITSNQILRGKAFRFKNDHRPRVLIVMAEREYKTNQTLPQFALNALDTDFSVDYVYANETERNDLPGLEALDQVDILLLSVRRRWLPQAQMDALRRFVAAGKAVVGVRTANHAFVVRHKLPPQGLTDWAEFDRDIVGGSYANHHGVGSDVALATTEAGAAHAILQGIDVSALVGKGSLYKVSPLMKSATALLVGTIPDKPSEPIAWTNVRADGGRTFYTSLGHPDDFEQPEFVKLLRNALLWAAQVNS